MTIEPANGPIQQFNFTSSTVLASSTHSLRGEEVHSWCMKKDYLWLLVGRLFLESVSVRRIMEDQ